jgi:hypothetical protein
MKLVRVCCVSVQKAESRSDQFKSRVTYTFLAGGNILYRYRLAVDFK